MLMAQLQLTKVISTIILMLFTSLAFSSTEFSCKEVQVQSQDVKAIEKSNLCFLKDDTYFITKNCSDLKCQFMGRLKQTRFSHSESERPGATMCQALKGVVEAVSIPSSKLKIQRCLFTKEKTSISLNLLESWDGKGFNGPSKPIKM
jgi:hypothetical protein